MDSTKKILNIFLASIIFLLVQSCKKEKNDSNNNNQSTKKATIKVAITYSPSYVYVPGTTCNGSYLKDGQAKVELFKEGYSTASATQYFYNNNGNSSTLDFGDYEYGNYSIKVTGVQERVNYCTSDTYSDDINQTQTFTLEIVTTKTVTIEI